MKMSKKIEKISRKKWKKVMLLVEFEPTTYRIKNDDLKP